MSNTSRGGSAELGRQGFYGSAASARPALLSYTRAKRVLDFLFALVLLVVLSVPLLILALAIKIYDPGPALYWQRRVGRRRKPFMMAKFRTMRVETPVMSTEEMQQHCASYVTSIGCKLRKMSIDELPQLWNVLRGEMSFVGPRPALESQTDVNELREALGVHELRPGITGLAQIKGRDDLSTQRKVGYDADYLRDQSEWTDLRILVGTVTAVLKSRGAK